MIQNRILIAYLLTVILAQAVFAAYPRIDLAVSGLFHTPGHGFSWAQGPLPTVNLGIRRLGEALTFLLIGVVLFGVLTGMLRGRNLRLLAYPTLCATVAAGVIVNLIFKAHVGRARPDTIEAFGGTSTFTPAWQITDQCLENCSFSSGESALAASLAIPIVVILWPHLSRGRGRRLAVLAAVLYIAGTSLLRIGLGRHFLSDTVFSVLVAAGTALVLYPLLRIAEARQHLPILAPPRPVIQPAEQRGVY